MGKLDIAAGRSKRTRGKANDIIGALTGDSRRQGRGKLQKAVGKLQQKLAGRGRRRTTAI